MSNVEKIKARLSQVNGKRRTRTLKLRGIAQAAYDLHTTGGTHEFRHGGHVANSYKYPATATAWLVYRDSAGDVRVIIREVSATKGSTGFGDRLRGDRLTDNSPAGEIITLGNAVELLYGMDFADDCPVGIVEDWLRDNEKIPV